MLQALHKQESGNGHPFMSHMNLTNANTVYQEECKIFIYILPASSSGRSEVQRVKLSLSNCMIKVLSLYDSSFKVSNSAMASSKACFAKWHALENLHQISL